MDNLLGQSALGPSNFTYWIPPPPPPLAPGAEVPRATAPPRPFKARLLWSPQAMLEDTWHVTLACSHRVRLFVRLLALLQSGALHLAVFTSLPQSPPVSSSASSVIVKTHIAGKSS